MVKAILIIFNGYFILLGISVISDYIKLNILRKKITKEYFNDFENEQKFWEELDKE